MASFFDRKDKDNKPKKGRPVISPKNVLMVCLILMVILSTISTILKESKSIVPSMDFITFMEKAQAKEIESVHMVKNGETFTANVKEIDGDGNEVIVSYEVVNPKNEYFRREVMDTGVKMTVSNATVWDAISAAIVTLPMLLIFIIICVLLFDNVRNMSTSMFKVIKPDSKELVNFDGIAGMEEVKDSVKFAVDTIKYRKALSSVGARPTNGVILYGPPGNGKTMLAKAIAAEAGVPFISTSGSDFVEMFVGLGAARVRALWQVAEINAPCVVFIDEIDAVGKKRSENIGNSETNQTLNALLQKMDGLDTNKGIMVVAATNMVEHLDSALTRPGRFDKQIYVGAPKLKSDRQAIVELYLKNKTLAEDTTAEGITELVFGLSGAEISAVINEAVIESIRRNPDNNGEISLELVGKSVSDMIAKATVTKHGVEAEKKVFACHEAGHAIIASLSGRLVRKITIVPYNNGIAGHTMDGEKDENKTLYTFDDIKGRLDVLVAGYVAEKKQFGVPSLGCSEDFKIASRIAFEAVDAYPFYDGHVLSKVAIANEGKVLINMDDTLKKAEELLNSRIEHVWELMQKPEIEEELVLLSNKLEKEETVYNYSFSVS